MLAWFLQKPEQKVKPILAVQSLQCKILDGYARFASTLCDEEFYLTVFTLIGWCISQPLARHLTTLMCCGYIFGNMLKNLLCVPRPISPPVRRVRGSYDVEDYSFPSTHSLQAVSLPIFLTYYIFWNLGYGDTTLFTYWMSLMVFLAASIVLSRLYLGAHYVQDVVAGVVVGTLIGLSYSRISTAIDFYLATGSYKVAVISTLFFVAMVLIHPNELYLNSRIAVFNQINSQSAYLVSSAVAGCAAGCLVGGWAAAQTPEKITAASLTTQPLSVVLRFLIGPTLLAAVYVTSKKVLRFILLLIWEILNIPLFDPPSKIVSQNKEENWSSPLAASADEATGKASRKRSSAEFNTSSILTIHNIKLFFSILLGSGIQIMPAVKFCQYFLLGFLALYICPFIFSTIGV